MLLMKTFTFMKFTYFSDLPLYRLFKTFKAGETKSRFVSVAGSLFLTSCIIS